MSTKKKETAEQNPDLKLQDFMESVDNNSPDISDTEVDDDESNPDHVPPEPPPVVEEKKPWVSKPNRPIINEDGSVYTGPTARIHNEAGVLKKKIPLQVQGLSSEMLPPITRRKVARYEVLGKDKVDPMTGQLVSPVPPLIIPGRYVVYDPFDSNVMARHKTLKNVTRSERVVRNGAEMMEEVVEDIFFDDGMKNLSVEKDYLMYVLLELHPLNESNRWRDKSQTAAFKRIDIDTRRWGESAVGLELAYEAETTVVNMRKPDDIIAYAHAAGIQTAGRILDGSEGTVKHDLRIFARTNPKEFFKLNKSTEAAIRISLLDAKDLGLIYYTVDRRGWFFSTDDVNICYHLPGEDPDRYLIKYLSTDEAKEKYSVLQNQLNYWD